MSWDPFSSILKGYEIFNFKSELILLYDTENIKGRFIR